MSRLVLARLGFAAGCAIAAAGVWLLAGLGAALVAAGVVAAASFLLLTDVGEG